MPKFNKELRDKGYIPVLPHLLYAAARTRKDGYLEEVTATALVVDGAFYLSKDDYDRIRQAYRLDTEIAAELPAEEISRQRKDAAYLEAKINVFLDLEQKCEVAEWQNLRTAYEDELNNKIQEGCTQCQINSIRNKYRALLRKL